MSNGWTFARYRIFRAILGFYLLVHFAALLPWAKEMFSFQGVMQKSASPLVWFPNLFWISDAPWMASAALCSGLICCLLLMAGKYDRVAAAFLWILWASLLDRTPLIANPSLPFVGWLLLAHVLIPSSAGENGMPRDIYFAAWIVMAVAYSYSGYTKLISLSWIDGSALRLVLMNPLARISPLRTWLLAMPDWMLRFATWSALTLELLFAPLALVRRIRPWVWTAMVLLQIGLVFLVNFADLTLGMLLVHLFTFDPDWLWPRPDIRDLGPSSLESCVSQS